MHAHPRDKLTGEAAYLFRHVLLRDAAYEMQLPSDRATLHAAALHALESAVGGRPPVMAALAPGQGDTHVPHATDSLALELAAHAEQAGDDEQWQELRRLYLRRAAAQAERQFQLALASSLYSKFSGLLHGAARAEALRRAADALRNGGRSLEAEPLLLQALEELRGCASAAGDGACLTNLALVYFYTGRQELAASTLQSAMVALSAADSDALTASALSTLGMLHTTAGDYGRALEYQREALSIHRRMGDDGHSAKALANLGLTELSAGHPDAAERSYHEGIRLARARNDVRTLGVCTGNLAGLCYETGRYEEAASLYPQALRLHRAAGNQRFEATCRCDYAVCLTALGRTDEAMHVWRQGVDTLREIGDTLALQRKVEGMHRACAKAGVPPFDSPEAA
ncbi:MAG: tetratricopeptide repeat protein [Planctomycetes bacterium]|nr:tetratricopeptide repeat protein [Planctomycetota bacterium]